MATKIIFPSQIKIFLITLFLVFSASLLMAQTFPEGTEFRLAQRLSWSGSEHIYYYEVIIEKEENGTYRNALRVFTETSYYMATLSPGHYRFCVIPYDYLEHTGQESEWMYIEVRTALQPALDDLQPVFIYEDRLSTLSISGSNFDPDAEMYIRRQYAPNNFGEAVHPVLLLVYDDGRKANLVFNNDDLVQGNYELLIKNPNGFETHKGGIVFAFEKLKEESISEPAERIKSESSVGFYLSAGFLPLFKIYGNAEVYKFILPGAALRAGMISLKGSFFNMGLDITGIWYSSNGTTINNTSVPGIIDFEFDMVLRFNLPHEKTALDFRFGIGSYFIPGADKQVFLTENVYANFEISLYINTWKNLFIEFGMGYAYLFIGSDSGALRPMFGAGWQF